MSDHTRMRAGLARVLAFARSAEPRVPVSRQAYSTDMLVALAFTLAALSAGNMPPGLFGAVQIILTTAPLALRRYCPLAAFWMIIAAIIEAYAGGGPGATLVTFFAIAFAAYSAVVHSRYRGATLLSMPVAAALIMAIFPNTAPPIPARATPLLIFIPIMLVGNAVHMWTRRAGDTSDRLHQAQAEHEAATRAALERERARIASELHDVVTHNVSVMVVQAGAARQVLAGDPDEATKALLAVESGGRAALTELRHLLGLLTPATGPANGAGPAAQRNGATGASAQPDGATLAPQPSLDELRSLVARVADAGLPVALKVAGPPRELPPGLGLTAYRVVQEALTNVLKHAGKPVTLVRLSYRADELVIEVIDDGPPIPAAGPAPGNGVPGGCGMGLIGLRERVILYGGELTAGPRARGGWLLTARIPVEPAAVSPAAGDT